MQADHPERRGSAIDAFGVTTPVMAFVLLLFAAVLAGCSSESDDSVVSIGSGLTIQGNVAGDRTLLSREVEIRAASGELTTTRLGGTGYFISEGVAGTGPWLLRVQLRDGGAWYAIAHGDTDSGVMTRNVNAFSDLALRNAFGAGGRSPEELFGVGQAIDPGVLPTAAETAAANAAVRQLVGDALAAHGLEELDLAGGDHRAIEADVSRFLALQSVFLQDGLASVFSTDPDPESAVSTVVIDSISVRDDLSAVDGAPPSSPTALRALPSASNEILLVWAPATDDRAIARYEITRDDTVIATTAYPQYRDLPLAAGTEYRYSVVAIDAAGNRSGATPPQLATPMTGPDTMPPQAPVNLTTVSGAGHVRLEWAGAGDDAAHYRVLRSVAGGMLDLRARLTATTTIDTGLLGGLRYCYSIVAVDASGNLSTASDAACATPPVDEGSGEPLDPDAPTSTPSAAGLAAVDVSDFDCDETYDGGSITGSTSLDAACYRVLGDVVVVEGGSLTVGAGTVLKFVQGASLTVAAGGALNASGTADFPIVFSGTRAEVGHWAGIRFENADSELNRLEQVVIEYAGQGEDDAAALALVSSEVEPSRLSVNGLLVRGSEALGFIIDAGTALDRFDAVVVTDSASPGRLPAMLAGQIGPGSSFRGNQTDLMELFPGRVERMTVWPEIDVPWDSAELAVSAPLSIPAGSELQFAVGRGVSVSPEGSLRAIGTSAEPVLFTGLSKEPGFWDGVSFAFSSSPDNRLEHVIIEYAGRNEGVGGLNARTSGDLGSFVSLESVDLRFNAGPGFSFEPLTRLGDFDNVTSTANGSTGTLSPDLLDDIGEGFMGTGNTEDAIVLRDATLRDAAEWRNPGVPYVFLDMELAAPVTIAAGTRLLARAGAEIRITPTGALSAVGTAAEPISFSGMLPTPGHWRGLRFESSNSDANRLEHVSLSHGGGGVAAETSGNVVLMCSASRGSVLSVSDTRIEASAGWGIYRQGATCQLSVEQGVSFSNNDLGDISQP